MEKFYNPAEQSSKHTGPCPEPVQSGTQLHNSPYYSNLTSNNFSVTKEMYPFETGMFSLCGIISESKPLLPSFDNLR
jgi:hypothetical protein